MTTTYTSRDQAIADLIIAPLGRDAADHDVDAIADEVLGDYDQGYAQQVDTDTFWAIVAKHARA